MDQFCWSFVLLPPPLWAFISCLSPLFLPRFLDTWPYGIWYGSHVISDWIRYGMGTDGLMVVIEECCFRWSYCTMKASTTLFFLPCPVVRPVCHSLDGLFAFFSQHLFTFASAWRGGGIGWIEIPPKNDGRVRAQRTWSTRENK